MARHPMLEKTEGFILDIDGSLVKGDTPVPGAVEAVRDLKKRGARLALFSNDSTRTTGYWAEKLKGMGFDIEEREVITSAVVAARFVKERYPDCAILPLGTTGLISALEAHDLKLIPIERAQDAQVVVMGRDPEFGHQKLEVAMNVILRGARFIATNLDPRVPVENGYVPAAGPMVKALWWATGVKPLVVGKPSRYAARMALGIIGVPREKGAVVGDQLKHDIRMGKAAGITSILVLSGNCRHEEVARAPERLKPDLVIPDVTHLLY